jgi:hypothetical protein
VHHWHGILRIVRGPWGRLDRALLGLYPAIVKTLLGSLACRGNDIVGYQVDSQFNHHIFTHAQSMDGAGMHVARVYVHPKISSPSTTPALIHERRQVSARMFYIYEIAIV